MVRSRCTRTALSLTLVALLATTTPGAATAAPPDPPPGLVNRGSAPQLSATSLADRFSDAASPRAALARTSAQAPAYGAAGAAPLRMPTSYPSQPLLRSFPDATPDDAADSGDLVGYDELAPRLNRLMSRSDRVSTQVIGTSTGGRDLYLVTVTAPETRRQTREQSAWRDLVSQDPEAAARDTDLAADYKTPIWISANIHGNEWEGTDAALRYLRRLALAPGRQVGELLSRHRLYFSLTLNPDGRTLGTRATQLGLDANRDMITNASPEAVSYVRTVQAVQPLYAADLHGYTGVLQVEPCGPPHGENYEYDLFLPHAYAAALQVERDVVAADIPGNTYYDVSSGEVVEENTSPDTAHIKIPYRDTPSGWDDYPPIFTAQYAAFRGAVTSTVELPKSRPDGSSQTPENARVNVAVARQTIASLVDYVATNSEDMLANQIEVFARGVGGEPKRSLTTANIAEVPGPAQWKPLWDEVDDQDPVELPRAYVIPVGAEQRSLSDASALVRQLLFHGIEVDRLRSATRIGGTRFPAGSYVVDMRQPLRGLANSLLDLGTDISAKVPEMYDISAWSYAYLWGATVEKVGSVTDRPVGRTSPVRAPTRQASLARADRVTFALAGVGDYRALNDLLGRDVEVTLLADGTPVVDATGRGVRAQLRAVVRTHDVVVEAATRRQVRQARAASSRVVEDLSVAYTGTQDDRLALRELGFDDLVPVDAASLTVRPSLLAGADVLWLGSGLSFADGQAVARRAVRSFVDNGGAMVGRGAGAAQTMTAFGVLQATPVAGDGLSNGIVAVETPRAGVLAPYAQDAAFVYPAISFVALGPRTSVEQSYADDGPLLAGHWVGQGTASEEYAAGKPSVVSGETLRGSRGMVFGTSVFFRTHPKGGMSQAARGIFWAAPSS